MTSLTDYAEDPLDVPNPLPDTSKRITRRDGRLGGWPVGLLPPEAIAEDAARLGVTYHPSRGLARDGEHLERDQLARLLADLLDEAARTLSRYSYDDGLAAQASGLRHTAEDLRVSTRARNLLVRDVRPLLPHPTAPPGADPELAAAVLATFDAETLVKRSAVVDSYRTAGEPGALTRDELIALADARWGVARKTGGHYVYRPADGPSKAPEAPSATPEERAELAAFADRYGYSEDRLAAFLAAERARNGSASA